MVITVASFKGGVGKSTTAVHLAAYLQARAFEHIVIDTKARPEEDDLRALALGCHLLVIPCTPDPLSLRALRLTVTALKNIGADRYRVLLTVVPPKPSRDGDDARDM